MRFLRSAPHYVRRSSRNDSCAPCHPERSDSGVEGSHFHLAYLEKRILGQDVQDDTGFFIDFIFILSCKILYILSKRFNQGFVLQRFLHSAPQYVLRSSRNDNWLPCHPERSAAKSRGLLSIWFALKKEFLDRMYMKKQDFLIDFIFISSCKILFILSKKIQVR